MFLSRVFSSRSSIAESTAGAVASVGPQLDGETLHRLKAAIAQMNVKCVPVSEAAIAAMAFLSFGNEALIVQAYEFGEANGAGARLPSKRRSLPELVGAGLAQGVPMNYALGEQPEVSEAPASLSRGLEALPEARVRRFPEPLGADEAWRKSLKKSVLKGSIDDLRRGECLVLQPPSHDLLMAARTAHGSLIVLAQNASDKSSGPGLKLYEARHAEERINLALKLPGSKPWALVRPAALEH